MFAKAITLEVLLFIEDSLTKQNIRDTKFILYP